MSPYLSDAEIADLTKPLTQGAARCRHLEREYGVKVKRAPSGQPVVGRAEFEAAMLAKGRARATEPAGADIVRPDWEALRAMRRGAGAAS